MKPIVWQEEEDSLYILEYIFFFSFIFFSRSEPAICYNVQARFNFSFPFPKYGLESMKFRQFFKFVSSSEL